MSPPDGVLAVSSNGGLSTARMVSETAATQASATHDCVRSRPGAVSSFLLGGGASTISLRCVMAEARVFEPTF